MTTREKLAAMTDEEILAHYRREHAFYSQLVALCGSAR